MTVIVHGARHWWWNGSLKARPIGSDKRFRKRLQEYLNRCILASRFAVTDLPLLRPCVSDC
jgi:hypothetical protein